MATTFNAGGQLVSVGQFYAAMYWGFVLSTSFVGISLVQGYLYYMRSNKDRWPIKLLVGSLLVFDPATSFTMAATIYYYFVMNFGVMEALAEIPMTWVVENGLTALVTVMAQIFFATRVYHVNSTLETLPFGRTLPILVFLFASIACVAGTVRTVFIGVWSIRSFSQIPFQTLVTVEESCALIADLLTTACLCYMLPSPSISSMKRSARVKTLFLFMINRVILMSIVQIGMLSSYLSAKDFLYWMPFHLCKSKLYTNTLLAMLNSREGDHLQPEPSTRLPWSMPVINLTIKESEGIVMVASGSTSSAEADAEKNEPSKEKEELRDDIQLGLAV